MSSLSTSLDISSHTVTFAPSNSTEQKGARPAVRNALLALGGLGALAVAAAAFASLVNKTTTPALTKAAIQSGTAVKIEDDSSPVSCQIGEIKEKGKTLSYKGVITISGNNRHSWPSISNITQSVATNCYLSMIKKFTNHYEDTRKQKLSLQNKESVRGFLGNPFSRMLVNAIDSVITHLQNHPLKDTIKITMKVSENRTFIFKVKDSGIGLNPSRLAEVNTSGYQSDKKAQPKIFGGMGIDLKLIRGWVNACGGSFILSSLGENQGATAQVILPLSDEEIQEDHVFNELLAEVRNVGKITDLPSDCVEKMRAYLKDNKNPGCQGSPVSEDELNWFFSTLKKAK